MPAQLYARWVPPKPVSKGSPISIPNLLSKHNITNVSPPASEQRTALEVESNESPKSGKKHSKKRKREGEIHGNAGLEDDTTSKKHKSIFSKFEKSSKISDAARGSVHDEPELYHSEDHPPEELHDLIPLPQPAPVPEVPFEPTFSILPSWLANPITVDSAHTVPFAKLGVHQAFVKKLEKQGMKDALAVQSVLLPMLHPGLDQHLGDICVSARTGSGKTLAYMLPVVEALKDRVVTALSALVVVPTRQLVDQARMVAEELCAGTKLKVGTAVGNVPFLAEQKLLVKRSAKYNPKLAKDLHERSSDQARTGFVERGGILDDFMDMPTDHVPHYESRVDILICTPGRLVEHIESTTGFSLRSMRWVVIDEADQLLNQNFQGWATTLIGALHCETPVDFINAQERICKNRGWPTRNDAIKIVLSATMKKDLTKLGSLRFKRPKLVVVQDDAGDEQPPLAADSDVFDLPSSLSEFAVPVGSGSEKPLYLLYLLQRHIFVGESLPLPTMSSRKKNKEDRGSSDTSSEDGSFSDDFNEETRSNIVSEKTTLKDSRSRVLVFTNSNESASRLSHLLSVLHPPLKDVLDILDRSATSKKSKRLLEAFGQGKIKILIASDLASRGLDILNLSHVINYDIPSSITSYVHRVGRTARAGKKGQAWTFFTKTEAGWFLNQVAKDGAIKRSTKKIQRVEWNARTVTWNKRRTYEKALEELQAAVEGNTDCSE
ncbi:P-loop containing nucleoside triphosphate hydrolase protein [Lindgomyces ingoldianus]|uniref:P-loop containing nucleoside triphosphate hydrolase protein n=1 Tax=Lindgomyces ingoldianus TaxID=673940 RepID=A0ACB6QHL9_9PLEO|nr:P-loop containing nucleoside triphosphate hydrolase protein [Lindgomyces ingoldianus]KAF2466382.1 P-loop containing nucleoside triphosphate hydrolase protein [Lindgomyces ingoldianus]